MIIENKEKLFRKVEKQMLYPLKKLEFYHLWFPGKLQQILQSQEYFHAMKFESYASEINTYENTSVHLIHLIHPDK